MHRPLDPAMGIYAPARKSNAEAYCYNIKEVAEVGRNSIGPLTMADAKRGLALTFGVAPEAIEVTICR